MVFCGLREARNGEVRSLVVLEVGGRGGLKLVHLVRLGTVGDEEVGGFYFVEEKQEERDRHLGASNARGINKQANGQEAQVQAQARKREELNDAEVDPGRLFC